MYKKLITESSIEKLHDQLLDDIETLGYDHNELLMIYLRTAYDMGKQDYARDVAKANREINNGEIVLPAN